MSVDEHGDEWPIHEPTEAEITWLYGEDGPPADTWTPRNLALAPDTPPVEPTLGGLGLLYPGKRHVFSGPQESAKTLAAYVAGLSVIREGGRVMLIDFEMGEIEAKRRLRELGASDEELGAIDYLEPETRITDEIAARLVTREPDLVIVDASAGAYDLQELDDNKRGDVERFSSAFLRPFWRAKIATLVIDHVVKNSEARGNYAIGSERKVGGADVHLGFTVITPIKRGTSGRYQITTHKDRGGFHKRGRLATFELASDPETHHFTWSFVAAQETDEEHPFRPTVLMERVSRYLEQQPKPVSRHNVEQSVTGKGTGIRQALDVLRDEGWITQTETENGSVVTSENPYREDDDRGSSPVRPSEGQTPSVWGSSLRPSPYGGTRGDEPTDGTGTNPPSSLPLDPDEELGF